MNLIKTPRPGETIHSNPTPMSVATTHAQLWAAIDSLPAQRFTRIREKRVTTSTNWAADVSGDLESGLRGGLQPRKTQEETPLQVNLETTSIQRGRRGVVLCCCHQANKKTERGVVCAAIKWKQRLERTLTTRGWCCAGIKLHRAKTAATDRGVEVVSCCAVIVPEGRNVPS